MNAPETLALLCGTDDDAPPRSDKVQMLEDLDVGIRGAVFDGLIEAAELAQSAGRALNHRTEQLRVCREELDRMRNLVEELSQPPWYVATFVGWTDASSARALVVDDSRRIVSCAPDLEQVELARGDLVYLSAERNTILGKADVAAASPAMRVVEVSRVLEDGGITVRDAEREFTTQPAGWLAGETISVGTRVLVDAATGIVRQLLGKDSVNGVDVQAFAADSAPPQFAGYARVAEGLVEAFANRLRAPELAAGYGLGFDGAITLLLHGPAGCGKTLFARNLAHRLDRPLFVINASSIYSCWVGETEQQLRAAFERAADAGGILFIDEIDAVGRSRGEHGQGHADRVLSVLLTLLDGAAGQTRIPVVGACNRPDLLDGALRSRFASECAVPRPEHDAVAAIAAVHLHGALKFADPDVRERAIERLSDRLTSPNADNRIATVRLQDGESREVAAADLVSGRSIQQLARAACIDAFNRELRDGAPGITLLDVDRAVTATINRWRQTVNLRNARELIVDLPQDLNVLAVDAHAPSPVEADYVVLPEADVA